MENNRPPTHTNIFHAAQGIATTVQKLSNKQSAKVVCRFDRLRISHTKRQKSHMSIAKLLSAYAFNNIVLKVNYGLTSCKDLAMAVICMHVSITDFIH